MLYDLAGNTLVEYRGWQSAVQQAYATYSYGADNEKLSVADANGNITNFGYDGFNRLTTTTYPDSTLAHPDVETLAYDKDSNITARTTRAGQVLNYTYDAIDRMTTKAMPAVTGVNPAVTTSWAYYLNGAVKTLGDTSSNSLTYGYDSAGRMTSTSTTIPGISGALVTGYVLDLDGNRTQLTWPDGYFVTYDYDSLDRMAHAKESGTTTIATYGYDALSRRTSLAYPAASMAYTYSPAGDLTSLAHSISGTTGTVPVYTLGYSPAHQLTSEGSSDPTYLLQLASTGTDTYSAPNSLNQYTTINGASASGHDCQGNAQQYSYDCNGNLTGDGTWSYAYDSENRLITAGKTSGGTVAATYAYDPLGRRTHKSGTGVTETYFLSDGSDEIAEYSSSGTGTWRYIPGPAINEPITTINASTGARKYFQTDHHGSVIAIVSNGGNELEGPYTYDSYGNCFTTGAACSTSGTPYRFTGMRLDPETGLYYDRARYYSSALGRFMQTDPVGYDADLNLYAYVENKPTSDVDPTGETGLGCAIGAGVTIETGPGAIGGCAVGEMIEDALEAIIVIAATAPTLPSTSKQDADDKSVPASDRNVSSKHNQPPSGSVPPVPRRPPPSGSNDDLPPSSAAQNDLLKKSLASEQQTAELAGGKGQPMAGVGTGKPIRDLPRLISQYGGSENDWQKVGSSSYTAADGSKFETHAYRNVRTGKVVEMKTKITP